MVSTMLGTPQTTEDPRQGQQTGQDPYATRDAARRQRYREYLAFYQGDQWEGRPLPNETRIVVNYARTLVRKAISYLFPEPVTFGVLAVGGVTEAQALAAELALAEVYRASDLSSVDFDTAVDAAVLGDGGFKVTWDKVERVPLVVPVDMQGISAWWSVDDPRRLRRVVQRVTISSDEARERYNWTPRGMPTSEASAFWVTVLEEWTPETLKVTVGGDVVRDSANPYGWLPFVLFPNQARPQEFWGESDLIDMIPLQRELNRRVSVVSRVLELSGSPIAVLENVEASEGIRVGPGAKWELPADSKAYLLDLLAGNGVSLHLDFIDKVYRAIHDLSETPRTSFGDSGRSLSGVALEVELQPLVQKVKRKRRVWESVYQRRNAMVLALLEKFGGLEAGGASRTRVNWPQVLPQDRSEQIDQAVKLTTNALESRRTAMVALGQEDPEGEMQRIDDEQAAEDARAAAVAAASAPDGHAGSQVDGVKVANQGQ